MYNLYKVFNNLILHKWDYIIAIALSLVCPFIVFWVSLYNYLILFNKPLYFVKQSLNCDYNTSYFPFLPADQTPVYRLMKKMIDLNFFKMRTGLCLLLV